MWTVETHVAARTCMFSGGSMWCYLCANMQEWQDCLVDSTDDEI